MKMRNAMLKNALLVVKSTPQLRVLFISDPANGDWFHVGTVEQLTEIELPATNEGSEITNADDLLQRLDFTAYAESPANFNWPNRCF